MTQRYPLLPRFLFFGYCACVHAQLLQSCLTLCNLMDYSPWGFFRQEYWRGLPCPSPGDLSNPCWNPCLFQVLHWQVGSLPFSRQKQWSGLAFPPPGDLPDLGIKPTSLMFPALAGRLLLASHGSPIRDTYYTLNLHFGIKSPPNSLEGSQSQYTVRNPNLRISCCMASFSPQYAKWVDSLTCGRTLMCVTQKCF